MGVFSRQSFGASGDLGSISTWLKNPNASEDSRIWNYGRYAYVTLSSNGTNNAGLCAPTNGITIGDTKLGSDNYQSLISRDGERDVPRNPLLESVRINNDGSTDVSDSALFDIDVSFKCYSASQFEIYEEAFFRVGNGVNISFGYKGLGISNNSMQANVYNFGFSMDVGGVYSCNLKLTGKNRFAAVLSMDQTLSEPGSEFEDEDGNIVTAKTIVGELMARFMTAHPDFEEPFFIKKASKEDFVKDGEAIINGDYAIANIQTKGGFDANKLGISIDFDDMFVKYVTFGGLIDVINKAHSKSNYNWGFGLANGKVIPQMASADPSILLLDGEMANYGGSEDGDTKNDLQTGVGFAGDAETMLLSLDFVTSTIKRLLEKQQEDKDSKGDTAVNNFLRVICDTIRDLTGGLYQLTIYNDGFNDSNAFLIVNERAEHAPAIQAGYTFTLHDLGSTLKSVSLSSNMDSDMAAAALVSNRSGTLPEGALNNLYSECGGVQKEVKPTVAPPTLDEVEAKKLELGLGFDAERVQSFKDVMKAYVASKPKATGTDTGYRYMIDLSVTTYGVWGTQIGDTFTFSGLPKKYKGPGKYFCVGKMEHSFDGQGGWETSYTGFLKLDTK